jgi:DNA-binding NtrC family response regulator
VCAAFALLGSKRRRACYHGRPLRTLLIVEDDAVLGGVLQAAFQREWRVELVENAPDALAAFREFPPDIVLTDKNLPGMDGMQLLAEIRKLDPTVGLVVMTAYGTVDSARDSIDQRVDAYIEKPFGDVFALVRDLDKLREKVVARRKLAPAPHRGAMRIGVVCPDAARRQKLKEFLGRADRIGWCTSVEDLASAVRDRQCSVTIVDCAALGADAAELVPQLQPRETPCIVVAEGLTVVDITKLIDMTVKALIDRPIDDSRFGELLIRALERIRCGTI